MPELLLGALAGVVIALFVAAALWGRGNATKALDRDQVAPTTTHEMETERRLERMVEQVGEGILYFSAAGTLAFANGSARRMFEDAGVGIGPVVRNNELMSIVRRAQTTGTVQEAAVTLWPAHSALGVRAIPVEDDDVIAVLRDIEEEHRLTLVRRQFVVSASHEMKTPVTAMQALVEAAEQALDANDLEAARRFVARLTDESSRAARLVQDLLDLSRVEDPSNISFGPVDLGSLVTSFAEDYRVVAESKSVDLKVSAAEGLYVRGDPSQLGLVVKNLVDNAVRYTTPSGSVVVELFAQGGEVVLRVEDTGIGIPLSAQSRVFERFFRVDEGRDRASGGTGLGLSIVKHVVDLHGGRISLESELGEGSTFMVFLPAGREPGG